MVNTLSVMECLEQGGEMIKNFIVKLLLSHLYSHVESYEDVIQRLGDDIKSNINGYEVVFASIISGGDQLSLDVQKYLKETYEMDIPRFRIHVYRTKGRPDLRTLERYRDMLKGRELYFFDDSVLTGEHEKSSKGYMHENREEWDIVDAYLVTMYDTQGLADITVFRVQRMEKDNPVDLLEKVA